MNPLVVRACSAILIVVASLASTASPPGSYSSNVDGVGLWSLYSFDNSSAGMTLEGERNDPFIEYCNGKNKIYIYELDSRGYICESRKTYMEYEGRQIFSGYDISVKGVSEKLNGVYTVSKSRIEKNSLTSEPLSKKEAPIARETAKKFAKQISNRNDSYKSKLVLGVEACNSPRCSDTYEKKLSLGRTDVMIVPTEYFYMEGSDEDLVSSIIVRESDSYNFLGHISGCFGQLVDIDGDGVPEIMTKTCQSGLSLHIDYWKIYPEVKLLVRQSGG